MRLSITYNGITRCSGSCLYCMAATNNDYGIGIDYNNIEAECRRVDDYTYNEFNADFPKLEELLDHHHRDKDDKELIVDIWGGDPVTSFKCLMDVTEFLEDYADRRNYRLKIHTSTNGLPLVRDDIVKFIREHKISIQLSHDGPGQLLRTKNIDPLEFPIIRELIREGTISCINCTLSFWNYSIYENIQYFNKVLAEIFPEIWSKDEMATPELSRIYRHISIKLNHIMDGDYNIKALHPKYKVPLGDVTFHNDPELQKKIGYGGHVLDNYIYEWEEILRVWSGGQMNNNVYFMPYKNYFEDQFRRGNNIVGSGNNCRSYQTGARDWSEHMDTTGRYCDCNLSDADHPVPNRENKNPNPECEKCRFRYSGECNMCGSVIPRKTCEYLYRWNMFLLISRRVYNDYNKSR